tara:strand:+ start:2025 stop:2300 length:276 start_codon:yes stop_codon:yes gene_type:complete
MGIQAAAGTANRLCFLEFAEHLTAVMPEPQLVETLVQQGLTLYATAGGELERSCWMVVHEHHHGVKPTEYDIREIDEELYLAVLEAARAAV